MELIINDLPEHGVVIHGPESPGFRERLLALMARFAVPLMIDDDALRYSFIVENKSPQDIIKISLTLGPYPIESRTPFSQGGGISNDLGLITQSSIRIPTGGQCPWNFLDGYGFLAQKILSPTGGDSRRENRDHRKRRLAAGDKWSVDIDYVIFGDGVFVGPDNHMQFDQIDASNRASRDMIAELNRKLDIGEDVFAYVEQCASITGGQINALYIDPRLNEPSPELLQTWGKKRAAEFVATFWQRSGKQRTVEWIRERAKSQIPLPKRVGPDTTQRDKRIEEWVRAISDFIAELNQILDDGEDIFAHIERNASMTREQIEALHPEARVRYPYVEITYAMSKKASAIAIIKRRERLGDPATIEWIRESAKSQIPLVRR